MKGILPILLFTVMIFCINCKNPFTYQLLKYSAANLNKRMPQYNKDSSVRFNNVVIIPDDTVVYERTLLKNKNWADLRFGMEKEAIDSMRFAKSFKLFKENNISLVYNFRDRYKNLVFSIYITPDKYKN